MTRQLYKRLPRQIRRWYPSIAATAALAIALVGVPGVTAGGLLITGNQIKNGTITSKDLHTGAVKRKALARNSVFSSSITTGAVTSSDIGEGEVTPEDVTMPDPSQCKSTGSATVTPGADDFAFHKVMDLCTYTKTDATSSLEVTWTGSVFGENGGEFSGCVFQLRVDGIPAPAGGGEVFGLGLVSVSASALYPPLPTGPHTVEVWARITVGNTVSNACTVGPDRAGIGQTTVVHELVV